MAPGPGRRAARGGELVWKLGTIKPGEEETVEVELMPTAEGEIGSVATVRFRRRGVGPDRGHQAGAADRGPRPASQVLIGEEIKLTITVSNPGSGVATGVVLEERVPAGVAASGRHRAGIRGGRLEAQREPQAGADAGGQPGPARSTNVLVARGDASLHTEDRLEMDRRGPATGRGHDRARSAATWSARPRTQFRCAIRARRRRARASWWPSSRRG